MIRGNTIRTSFIASGFFVLALFFGTVTQAQASTFTVTKTADTADGTCNADCSLREAMIAANSNSGSDTISIPAGTYLLDHTGSVEDSSATGDLDATDTNGILTITGSGSTSTIIDGNATDRVMDIMSGTTAVISNLTLTNGRLAGSGAGIQALGTTTLNNVVVSYNVMSAMGFGGGIRCDGNSLTITNSTISYNSTLGPNSGAGMNANLCNLTITGSTFTHNTSASSGGAIIASTSTNTLSITDTAFTYNTAPGSGGAIYVFTTSSGSHDVLLNRVTMNNNTSGYGGAMYLNSTTHITNTTIVSNTASQNGGAIYALNDSDTNVTIAASTVVQNTSEADGGGIYVDAGAGSTTIKSTILAANAAHNSSLGPDCYATANLTSSDYNFFGSASNCTFTSQSHDDTTTGTQSYMATATLADNGGSVETLNIWGVGTTLDLIPPASCTDAAGAALAVDARGMTRAQNTNCDRGAYEKDQTNPTVTLTSGTDTVECHTGSWVDAGATATDNFSTGLTAAVTSGSVTVNTVGSYPIVYTSTADGDNNTGTTTRTVTVSDTTAPVITMTGSSTVSQDTGTTYTDAGATVSDACDSTVTVTTTSTVNTAVAGTYTVTYTARDASNNTATSKVRTVTITAPVVTITPTDPTTNDTNQAETELVDTTTSVTPTIDTDGQYITVTVNGAETDRVRVSKKKLSAANYTFKTSQFYAGYTTVAFLSVKQHTAKLTVLRLQSDNTLTKKVTQRMTGLFGKSRSLKVKPLKHKLIVLNKFHWKLTKRGHLTNS